MALAAAPATTLPPGYRAIEAELAPGCNRDTAHTVANLTWDIDIHATWISRVNADPSLASSAGSAEWHRYWISVYQHTIRLLLRDCRAALAPDAAPQASGPAEATWTYTFTWHTQDGRPVTCVVPAHGSRHCRLGR